MSKFVKGAVVLLATAALGYGIATYPRGPVADQPDRDLYLKQLENNDRVPPQIQADYTRRSQAIVSELWVAGGGGTLLALLYAFVVQARSTSDLGGKPAGHREL